MTVESRVVIYIEDNLANLKLVEKVFARIPDVDLLSSQNGKDGLELVRRCHPALVLMDINLPDIGGYELVRQLKFSPELRDIPVIAVTANAMSGDIEKGMQAGFDDYLTKPIDVPEFIEAIGRYVCPTQLKQGFSRR